MAIFKTLKNGMQAATVGLELLNKGAQHLEEASERLLIRAEDYRLRTELECHARNLEILFDDKAPSHKLVAQRVELIDAYRKLIDFVGSGKNLTAERRLAELEEMNRIYWFGCLKEQESGHLLDLEIDRFYLPVHKLNVVNQLVDVYRRLQKLDDRSNYDQYEELIAQYRQQASELNEQRYSKEEIFYPSGNVQAHILYRDGAKHGLSKYWYDSGELQAELEFAEGKLHGKSIIYHRNGVISHKLQYKDGKFSGPFVAQYSNGVAMLTIERLPGAVVTGKVKLWNDCWIATMSPGDNLFFMKVFIFFNIAFSFNAIKLLYRFWRYGEGQEYFDEFVDALNISTDFHKDVESLLLLFKKV